VKALEERLGARLFERDRRGVLVTPEGRRVLARARALLRDVDELVAAARAGAEPFTEEIRLGADPTIGPYLLPRVLPAVRNRWPELRLPIREGEPAELAGALDRGELDLALLPLPAPGKGREEMLLFRERLVLVVPGDHPLAEGEKVAPRDLEGEDVLSVHGNAGYAALVQMAANGLGVAVLPALAAAVEARPDQGVVTRPFRRPAPDRKIGLAWRSTSPRGEDYRLLGRTIVPQ
jgi:LysR family hydrogen peroxide-inducible transcriptional activator